MKYEHLKKYFQGKKIFLTGHTGFKGSWLLVWLKYLGAEVKGYSLAPKSDSNLYAIIDGDSLCQSTIADIRNQECLVENISSFQPDFIFHLAAQPLVRVSYEIPSETFMVNAIGTAYLLDSLKKIEKNCVTICVTTDKVYDNKEWHYPYREQDRLGGYDPYSASKACAELVISSYRDSFFNLNDFTVHQQAIASVRAGNVIGGGDWAKDRIIPDIINALQHDQLIPIRNPNAVRPWQHVLEPLAGYLHLATKLVDDPIKYSLPWNFGPKSFDTLSVEQLVKLSIKVWGSGNYIIKQLENQPHEANLLKLDISNAENILGWTPKYNALQAIEKTIDWYKQNNNGIDGRILIEKSIKEYCA